MIDEVREKVREALESTEYFAMTADRIMSEIVPGLVALVELTPSHRTKKCSAKVAAPLNTIFVSYSGIHPLISKKPLIISKKK